MPVFTEGTSLKQIEILSSGRIQFQEQTQIYKDGVPLGSPEYHRSAVEPGYLDENDELLPFPLPLPIEQGGITKGLNTDLDLEGIVAAVRTPEVMAAWKEKLLSERVQKSQIDQEEKKVQADLNRMHEDAKANEEKRIADLVAAEVQKQKG
jgi:hypothetical protein